MAQLTFYGAGFKDAIPTQSYTGSGDQHEVDALTQARDALDKEIAKRLPARDERTERPLEKGDK